MCGLFGGDGRERPHFNEDLSRWNVSRVTNMFGAFYGATAFTGAGIGCWDVSSVTRMDGMLCKATAFNEPIGDWDVSRVKDMSGLFKNTGFLGFNEDISKWDTSSVTTMEEMFCNNDEFDQDISEWDTSSVTNLDYAFTFAENFNSDISKWDTSNVRGARALYFSHWQLYHSNITQHFIHASRSNAGTIYTSNIHGSVLV